MEEVNEDRDVADFEFASVVVPASWIPQCNYALSWNNNEMSSKNAVAIPINQPVLAFISCLLPFTFYYFVILTLKCHLSPRVDAKTPK